MKKFLTLAALGLFVLASVAVPAISAAEIKIGFVDIDRAANESTEGKKAIVRLKDLMDDKQTAVNEKGKNIEKMKADLEKQAAVISADAKRAKIEEIERMDRDFQRMLSDVNLELEKKRRELTETIYKDIIEIIEKIAREEKYDAILPPQSVLYANKSLDITDNVIKKYNEQKASKGSSKK